MNGDSNGTSSRRLDVEADKRLRARSTFDVAFNLIFLMALHGTSSFKILFILYVNFTLATKLNREYVPIATWIFNVAILFANELAEGYSYAKLSSAIFLSQPGDGDQNASWGALLDSYGGLQPRWDIHFNFTVLRLISFNLDHLWAVKRSGSSSPIEVM